jgi:hypothetical protein
VDTAQLAGLDDAVDWAAWLSDVEDRNAFFLVLQNIEKSKHAIINGHEKQHIYAHTSDLKRQAI